MITKVTKLRATKRADANRDEIARSLETEASKRASVEMRREANLAELERRLGQKSLPSRSQLEKEARERARVAFAQLAQQSIEKALAWADELEEKLHQRARSDEQELPQPALSRSLTRRGKGGGGGLSPLRAQTPEQVVAARSHWMQKQRRSKFDKDKARGDDLRARFSVLSCDMSEPSRDHDGTQDMDSSKGPDTSSDEEDAEYKEQLNKTMTQLSDELFYTRRQLDRVRMKRTYFDASFSFALGPELTSSAQRPPLKSEHLTLMAEEAELHEQIKNLQTRLTSIFSAIEHPSSRHAHVDCVNVQHEAGVGDVVALQHPENMGEHQGQVEVEGAHEGRVLAELDDICVELKRLKEAWGVTVADEECALIAPGHRSVCRFSDYLEKKEEERESDVHAPKSERLAAEIEALQERQQDLLDMLETLETHHAGGEESEAGEVVKEEGLPDSHNFPVDVCKAEKAEVEVVVEEVGAAGEEVEWVMMPKEIERRSSLVPEIEDSNPLPHALGAPQSGEELEIEISEKQTRQGGDEGEGVERSDGGQGKGGVAGQWNGEGEGQGERERHRLVTSLALSKSSKVPLSTPGARSRFEILKRQHDKGWVFAASARRGGMHSTV
jgi:hypothetical protein